MTDSQISRLNNSGAARRPDDQILKRAEQLDALDAILPFDRRDQLAALLTDEDVATLKHLASEGMGENTLRALASDFGYLEGWAAAADVGPLPWPAPQSLILKFIAHHMWDVEKRALDPAHGMPHEVEQALRNQGLLRSEGPHSPATVKRRLTSWSILTRWRGLEGNFSAPSVKSALKLAVRAAPRSRQRKSRKAVTGDILAALLKTCNGTRPAEIRDTAILLLAFASGGRRRSEVANLRVEDLVREEPVRSDPDDPNATALPCMSIHVGRTKTTTAEDDATVYLVGRPVIALQKWLETAKISEGPVFRKIDQWGNIDWRPLSPQSINLILKTRVRKAGLDPSDFSAHGLRAGYLTEAANRGIPLPEAMQQSLHRSVNQAAGYYNNAERKRGKAARLMA